MASMQQIDFVTLGMFIIDEIEFLPPTPSVRDIVGGGGSYSALGARLMSPAPELSRTVGWIVDCGHDFPVELREVLQSWQTTCVLRETPERATTRGWNGYNELQERAFKYMTPKLRLDHNSLTPELLRSRSFHLLCSPLRCIDVVEGIMRRRGELDAGLQRPLFVWEPIPDLCTPTELENCFRASRTVDVVSPNHSELCAFFGKAAHESTGQVARDNVRQCCGQLLERGVGHDGLGVVVVRAGAEGCCVATAEARQWLPAFHRDATRVADPTGGGNTFLGGLAVGMVRSARATPFARAVDGAMQGSVAASFAIEQIGMPTLAAGRERWNGVSPAERLLRFTATCGPAGD